MTDKIRPDLPFKDRLMPTPANPSMRYVDYDGKGDRIWEVNIRCFHDKDSTLSKTKNHQGQGLKKTPYASLDALVEDVYLGRDWRPRVSEDNFDRQKFYIAHSATNHYDIISSVTPSTKLFRRLQTKNGHLSKARFENEMQSQHILLKNGVRDVQYKTDDGIVTLDSTISGSWDRESPKLQMARRTAPAPNGKADPKAPSDFYTGRPDTEDKAREMAEMVFFGELEASQQKGLELGADGVYTLRFVVNSLISTSPLYALGRAKNTKSKGVEQEQEYFERERQSLKALQKKGVMQFTHPVTGKTYNVRVEPVLLANQVNFAGRSEKTLSPAVSGAKKSIEASREGWKTLKQYAEAELVKLSAMDNPDTRKIKRIEKLISLIENSLNVRYKIRKDPEEELLCYALLCRLLKLPQVVHCKSSTDRTSFAIMATTLRQWENLGLPIPENVISLLDDEDFKELFMANWEACHAITRNARAPHGVIQQTVNGKKKTLRLDHEKLGLQMERGLAINLMPARLLPKRYLKDYGKMKGLADAGKTLGKAIKKVGIKLLWTKPTSVAKAIYWHKKIHKIPVLREILAGLGALFTFLGTATLFTAGLAIGLSILFGRGVYEIGYPFASDLPFKAPKNKYARAFATFIGTPFVFTWRILQYLLPLDSNYWYGTMRPPEPFKNRIANAVVKWLCGLIIGPFVMFGRLFINPYLAVWRAIPDKVIDEEQPFVKNRRLIAGSRYNVEFEESYKAIPSDARKLSEYNEKFMKRFLNKARPVQEIVYADTITENLKYYPMEPEDSIEDSRLYAQFRSDLGRGFKYTIDGRVFEGDDQDQLAEEIFVYLRERCKNHDGIVDEDKLKRALAACQQGTGAAARRHIEQMLIWKQDPDAIDAEDMIIPWQGTEDLEISLSTLGKDWTLQMKNPYHLRMGSQKEIHANIQAITTVNLTTGQADVLFKLQDLDKHGTQYIPFGLPTTTDGG